MKHSGFAWIAAFSLSVLAALPFNAAAQDSNPVFDKTTARLEKGGIAYSFTDGASAYKMVDQMFDSFEGLVPEGVPQAKQIFDGIREFAGSEFGLKTFLGSGTSVKKTGDYYRCIDFEYAPEHKGLFWDMFGAAASKGPAAELKLTSPKSAVAFSGKMEPGALYAFIDKKLRSILSEEDMAVVDQQISDLASAGIQPDKLLECLSGITFYVEGREYKQEDLQGLSEEEDPTAGIVKLVPKFALIFTTKSDICWKALENFLSQNSPELVQDGKIVPLEGFAVFQDGNYLVATNDEAAIRDRIAGKGSDLTSNAEFAKMAALASKDFSGFSWVSDDYYKMLMSITKVFGAFADDIMDGTDPSIAFIQNLHAGLWTAQVDAEGLVFNTITSDLQVALMNSGTVAGVVSGILPCLGPVAQAVMKSINDDDDSSADNMERQIQSSVAFAMLKEATVPADAVFFALGEDGELAFVKWDKEEEMFAPATEGAEDIDDFPFVFVTTPDAASKAENPEEVVVFYEDPTEFVDGLFFVFGDGSVKFLDGDFDDHAEALEAAANTFGLSDKAAADLIKKGAAIDKYFE